MTQKNILIVTASIGSGHNKAAAAVNNELKNRYPSAKINVVDFMSPETAYLNDLLKEIYLKMLDFIPALYEFLYNFTSGRMKGSSIQVLLAYFMKHNMASIIEKYRADIIICTHPFPCAAASYLKSKKKTDAMLFTVVTDFCLHQIWIYKNVDMYFIAHEGLKQELLERGIGAERVAVTGIPINKVFSEQFDKNALLTKFELNNNTPIILIMGGGLGLGSVKYALEALENLAMPMQILVVAGANISLWSEVNCHIAHSRHLIKVWGYSHNINELMAISTLLISKPGALTISEAMARELPMVLHAPIPGPESENATYLADNGVAIWVQKKEHISETVKEILTDKERLLWMKQNARNLKEPYAASKIVDAMSGFLAED
ncbi:MGDG synthase family glycosyltransferase [Pectinatus haikarae]|uniref:Processive 1,2-diacylglycerol beta-glucosyltransferase n=1 Tax=Pectinatus haikarae TaxID=349096 RepID=A0ABT9Y6H9_9FIRM|nr:glycosyltransferase [Pectinatus haikarae]MDQ0202754.1 processive 1,2-diacylglycerol beta-glucosyltransferase [Pectinatus haikarae]